MSLLPFVKEALDAGEISTPEEVAHRQLRWYLERVGKEDWPFIRASMIFGWLMYHMATAEDRGAHWKQCDLAVNAVTVAAKTDPSMRLVCAELFKIFIESDMPMPESLKAYAVDTLAGRVTHKTPGGRPRQDLLNGWIVETIKSLITIFPELKATRNETSDHPSACSIVSEILSGLDHDLTERSVEQIWTRNR